MHFAANCTTAIKYCTCISKTVKGILIWHVATDLKCAKASSRETIKPLSDYWLDFLKDISSIVASTSHLSHLVLNPVSFYDDLVISGLRRALVRTPVVLGVMWYLPLALRHSC